MLCWYLSDNQDPLDCVPIPNQASSIQTQLFVIIVEKGVKGFTQFTVLPLAYASLSLETGFHTSIIKNINF